MRERRSRAEITEACDRELVYIRLLGDSIRQSWAGLLWRQWIETGAV